MTIQPQSPTQQLALVMMGNDLHYSSVMLSEETFRADLSLVQFAVTSAYEAQRKLGQFALPNLNITWDPAIAEAARMSGKFFEDTRRRFAGVTSHLDSLLKAAHAAYFPPDRLCKEADFLRTDMSVLTVDDRPYMSSIGAHFLAGLNEAIVASLATIGPQVLLLTTGIGDAARDLLDDPGLEDHARPAPTHPKYFNCLGSRVLSSAFGGELAEAESAAAMTVHSVCIGALLAEYDTSCQECTDAVAKRRFMALYHALLAMKTLQTKLNLPTTHPLNRILSHQETAWVLDQRHLRNAYMHYGTEGLGNQVTATTTVGAMVSIYTGEDSQMFKSRVLDHLDRTAGALELWMETVPANGRSFRDYLQPAEE